MASMKEMWDVRRASLHDRDALKELCRAAAREDDYVIERLESMILHGVMDVALDGGRIVGMMHYSEGIDGSAWLAAARTHPAYRRRGVAASLIQNAVGLARRSRVHALRLVSAASNAAGTASVLANGFHEVARFTRVKRATSKGALRTAALAFDADLVREITDSKVLRIGNGYVPYGHYFVPLTPANVHLLANARAFFRVGGGIAVVSADSEDPATVEGVVEFGLVAGDPSGILRALPGTVGQLKELKSFLPFDRVVVGAAHRAGFEVEAWGRKVVLYERPVEVGPTTYRKRRTYAEIAAGKREGYAALALLAGGQGHGHTGPHEDRWNP